MLLRNPFIAASLLAALLCSLPAAAADGHDGHDHGPAGAHVHGAATLDLAAEGDSLSFHLTTPLDNLVGFERAPRTAAERTRLAEAVTRLRHTTNLFTFDPAAGCVADPVTIDSPFLAADGSVAVAASGAAAGHSHPPADDHAELQASYRFRCAEVARAKHVDLGFFVFTGLRAITVQGATPSGQFKRELKRPSRRLRLDR